MVREKNFRVPDGTTLTTESLFKKGQKCEICGKVLPNLSEVEHVLHRKHVISCECGAVYSSCTPRAPDKGKPWVLQKVKSAKNRKKKD